MSRHYSFVDECLMQLDQTLRLASGKRPISERDYPAQAQDSTKLTDTERRHAAGLIRVDHTGEVCAQALYQGQALTARDASVRDTMQQAAKEEIDHLAWCEQRLHELNSRTSYLNPIWYLGSLFLGIAAGVAGDKWSLGFLAETERQVTEHLEGHLKELPAEDIASRQIIEQMKLDEQQHAHTAVNSGAAELPLPIKLGMKFASKLMTGLTYYL